MKDDIQLLYDNDQIFTTLLSSPLDEGLANVKAYTGGSITFPYSDTWQYTGALGGFLPDNYVNLVQPYLFPSSPRNRAFQAQIPIDDRDRDYNAQSILKLQYQKNFSPNAYARIYGFPIFGEAGVKVAQDAGGKAVDPDTRGFEPDPEISARTERFLSQVMPSALGRPILTKTCLYTLTPDRDFVVDTLPHHPHVSVAIGAGHAFKFASVIGRILSELALAGTTAADIADFEIDRPILQLEAPPKTYMV